MIIKYTEDECGEPDVWFVWYTQGDILPSVLSSGIQGWRVSDHSFFLSAGRPLRSDRGLGADADCKDGSYEEATKPTQSKT